MAYEQDILSMYFTNERLVTMLFFRKLKENNLLSDNVDFNDFESHFSHIKNDGNDIVSVEIDDEALGIDIKLDHSLFDFTDNDFKALNETVENISSSIDIEKHITDLGEKLVSDWNKQAPELLQKRKDEQADFRETLSKTWGKSLDLLDMLLSTSLDIGVGFHNEYKGELAENDAIVFHVINHLFGRACNIVSEIHILLCNGFADGAEARWRTLHEVVVVAIFIMQYGYDVAERFIWHEKIDTLKVMNSYKEYWDSEGIKVISESDFSDLQKDKQELLQKFGNDFKNDYGWANKALNKQRVTFFDIEKATKLDYLRPSVKEANNNIHSSSRGTTARLGLPNNDDMILAGSSIFGLGEVIRNTAFSFLILFENFLMATPTIENRVQVSAAYKICDLIQEANIIAIKTLSDID